MRKVASFYLLFLIEPDETIDVRDHFVFELLKSLLKYIGGYRIIADKLNNLKYIFNCRF